jgi:hypothetical protein
MPKAFCHEQSVVVDGETFILVINFRAIDATEQLLKCGYDEILADIQRPNAPVGLMGKVLWGLLREHHSDLSLDQVLTLSMGQNGLTVGLAMSELLSAAFPTAEKEKGKNPPKRGGRSQSSESNG